MMDRTTALDVLTTSSGWFKSSRSQGANGCVELNLSVSGHAGMRDSKLGHPSPMLLLPSPGLPEFIRQIQAGRFDR
jgi:hypothetical protein